MTTKTRNDSASYGLHLLKNAVLGTLYDRRCQSIRSLYLPRSLSMKEVRENLGLPHVGVHNNLIRGILNYLQADEFVEEVSAPIRWQITEKGVKFIES